VPLTWDNRRMTVGHSDGSSPGPQSFDQQTVDLLLSIEPHCSDDPPTLTQTNRSM